MSRKPKFYTTKVPAAQSLSEIRRLLADVGAERLATLQDFEANTAGIQFFWEGQAIQLIIDLKAIEKKLAGDTKVRLKQRGPEGAERVAYRLLLNWLANNFELVRWGIFDTMEVFRLALPEAKK